jgi:hypothetical protein
VLNRNHLKEFRSFHLRLVGRRSFYFACCGGQATAGPFCDNFLIFNNFGIWQSFGLWFLNLKQGFWFEGSFEG